MLLKLTTNNSQAFESLTDTLRAIDHYYQNHNILFFSHPSSLLPPSLPPSLSSPLSLSSPSLLLSFLFPPSPSPPSSSLILNADNEPNLQLETRFN